MLFLLGVFLMGAVWYLLDRKLIHRQPRKWTGVALITIGATTIWTMETHIDQLFIWSALGMWCMGLELFFNCDKYKDYYW